MDAQKRTAIDSERLAGDVARLLRTEERTRGAELRRVAQPTHRRGGRHTLDLFFRIGARGYGHLADAVGEDAVRGEAVDGDAVWSELARKGLRETRHRGAHRVRQGDIGDRLADRDRRDAHDSAFPRSLQVRQPGSDQPHRAHEREVKGDLPQLERRALESARRRATGVDDQHIEAGQPLDRRLDEGLGFAWTGYIGGATAP